MSSLTEQTARLISGFDAAAVPEEALHRSKVALMDCVGVALAGFREPVSRIVRQSALDAPGAPQATIWGTAKKVAALEAALVNGTTSHALDYDDMNRSMLGHPTTVLAPALFALAEKNPLPGRQLLAAYVLGLEVMARIGRIFGTAAYEKSWHSTAILGVVGACASTCHLLRLGHSQVVHALGIAASEASGIKKNFGSMTKPLHAGSAARKGMWAALVAQRGLTAGADALDGTFGFMEMFGGRQYAANAADETAGSLEILRLGLAYKQYPCCGGLHSVLDNTRILMEESVDIGQISDVECRVHPHKVAYLDRPRAREELDAKFSIQYCVTAALLDGKVGLGQFTAESLARPSAHAMMKKIRVTAGADLASFASEVIIRKTDGTRLASSLPEPRGAQKFPFADAELLQKFVDCASLMMSETRARDAGAAFLQLEREPDAASVISRVAAD